VIEYKYGNGKIHDNNQSCDPGEKTKHHKHRAEQLRENDQYQGITVSYMKWIIEPGGELGEIGDLRQSMSYQQQQSRGHPLNKHGKIESAIRICSR